MHRYAPQCVALLLLGGLLFVQSKNMFPSRGELARLKGGDGCWYPNAVTCIEEPERECATSEACEWNGIDLFHGDWECNDLPDSDFHNNDITSAIKLQWAVVPGYFATKVGTPQDCYSEYPCRCPDAGQPPGMGGSGGNCGADDTQDLDARTGQVTEVDGAEAGCWPDNS